MGKLAFVFPGQGSQYPGMGRDLAVRYPQAARLFQAADQHLGESLSQLCFQGPAAALAQTANTQPAVLITSLACWAALVAEGIEPHYVAGHSLGEYTALVAAGVLDPVEAVWLVRQRGRYMEEACPGGRGAMAAVLGLDAERVAEICSAVRERGVVQPANLNAPGQVVVSGERAAVEAAAELAEAKGAKKVVFLEVSGPFHSPLMAPAVPRLAAAMEEVTWRPARVPVVANATADYVVGVREIRQALEIQLTSPVRWEESVQRLVADGVDTFVELGPGRVLSALIKRIDRRVRVFHVEDFSSLTQALASLREAG